jgi:hypothetical protein
MPVPQVQQTSFRPTTVFELEALEGLQCGCVTVAYRTRPWGFIVVALERKDLTALGGYMMGQFCTWDPKVDPEAEEGDAP